MVKRARKIKHMGVIMTEEEHERWHGENHELTPEEHEALMKRMGISREEDKK